MYLIDDHDADHDKSGEFTFLCQYLQENEEQTWEYFKIITRRSEVLNLLTCYLTWFGFGFDQIKKP